MYSLDVIYFIIFGAVSTIFGFVSPNIFLILAGIALLCLGIYLGYGKSPKVLDESKYKRRFMTDNSMAYVAIDGSKKDNNFLYGYAAFTVITFLIAIFAHNFITKISSGLLACASLIIMFAWIMRGESDVYWMPGESRPVRIFYNESKFKPDKPDEPKKKEGEEVIEPEVIEDKKEE